MNDLVEGRLDIEAPIDIEAIETEVQRFGPLRLSRKGYPYELHLMISQCRCGLTNCTDRVVTLRRVAGLSEISWTEDASKLNENYSSLDDLFEYARVFGPTSSSGERQVIEMHILNVLGKPYYEIDHPFCNCAACGEAMDGKELWQTHLLTALALSLNNLYEWRNELDDDDVEAAMSTFDAGFALGRLVGEYFLKEKVEADALRGKAAAADVATRTDASGKASAQKKRMRLEAMLENMEAIAAENPAIIRLGLETLAGLAIEDAAERDPKLWSQGRGQKQEYLDELRVDIEFRPRILKLQKPL